MGSRPDHDQVLCMTGGTGETSYATNSFLQKNVIQSVEGLLKEDIESVCLSMKPARLTMADLGCSSGPNALEFVQSVIDVAVLTCQRSGLGVPEFNAYMNDLPQNDFNTIFKSLPSFYKKIKEEKGDEINCFISGTPGSFYGRLFPCHFLHFVHSSYSLHWRSRVPEGLVGDDGKESLNKGCIYAKKGSPLEVLQAFQDQFTKDFTVFLNCRSKELVNGGRMLLTMVATDDDEISVGLETLNKALYNLASKGIIDKERLDAFNLPYHRPTIKQAKQVIEDEGSFAIHKLSSFMMPWNVGAKTTKEQEEEEEEEEEEEDKRTRIRDAGKSAKFMAKTMRAAMESILVANFGEALIDDITNAYEEVGLDYFLTDHKAGILNLVISMTKI